ncbi:MAG: PIG-L deacetylase family protein, partial [Terriglobia bacterium]
MRLDPRRLIGLLSLWLVAAGGLFASAAPSPASLEKLPVITTIAYITAHPDDESGAMIAYFARGLGARVVLLCLTRGEGGQNTYGPDLGEELGRIRTRELEAAARIYGAEVRFLGALDFGYSKSVEETLERWDEAALVERLVRVLRELKPDVVIAHWTPEAPAGAHHQAAGIVSRQAYALVGDPAAYPEQQAAGLAPWPVRYLVSPARGADGGENFRVPVEEVDPHTGKSYREIGWEGFRQHRSQGLDRIPRGIFRRFRRRSFFHVDALRVAAPLPREARELVQQLDALPLLFLQVGILPAWQERLEEVVRLAQAASRNFGITPAEAAKKLISGAVLLEALREELQAASLANPEALKVRELVETKQTAFLRAAAALAGIEVTAAADRARVAPGERFRLRLALRRGVPEVVEKTGLRVFSFGLSGRADWPREPVLGEASA